MLPYIKQINNQDEFNKVIELRKKIFCVEQNVDEIYEIDEYDNLDNNNCKHYAYILNDKIIGTFRIIDLENKKKISRVAIDKDYRGLNYGYNMLYDYINNNKDNYYLEAQTHAIKFYKKLGFKTEGEPFILDGIKHIKMHNDMHKFIYSNTNKRYHTLDYSFKDKYNNKVARIMINAGFTCPNIDGTKSFDGCTFCSIKGSGDFAGLPTEDLLNQWEKGKKLMQQKWPNAKFIAYFQAFSNTYAPLEVLKEKYEIFLDKDDCIGISIATRPDCLDDEKIEYLSSLNKKTNLIIELGLQSIHEETSKIINRCHTTEEFNETVKKLKAENIEVVVHIINGLPKETKEMMVETAKHVSKLDIDGIKIHLLHVVDQTKLVNQLNNGFLKLLTKEEYIDIVITQIEYLNPKTVIHRITGDAPPDIFIGPIWSKYKRNVINDIDKEFVKRNTYQGRLYDNE